MGWWSAREANNEELEATYWNVHAEYCGWWGAG